MKPETQYEIAHDLLWRIETCLKQATRTFETTDDEFTRIQAHAKMDAYRNALNIIKKVLKS